MTLKGSLKSMGKEKQIKQTPHEIKKKLGVTVI
jgi:hypothetical protein